MEFDQLHPEQLHLAIKLCECTTLEDIGAAVFMLEKSYWNLEQAVLNLRVEQHVSSSYRDNQPVNTTAQEEVNPEGMVGQDDVMEIKPEEYAMQRQLLEQSKKEFKQTRDIQNQEYLQMEREVELQKIEALRQQQLKKQEAVKMQELKNSRERKLSLDRQHFSQKQVTRPLPIKFRTPQGQAQHTFDLTDTLSTVYEYVHCFLRDKLDSADSDFDLQLSYPLRSLAGSKSCTLGKVFGEDSEGEVLLVKEIVME